MIWAFLIAAVILLVLFWSGPAPLRAAGGVNRLEQIMLGGVKQWISIRGAHPDRPVLLFLHGGPGSANLAKLRVQVPELEQHFVVVNWDQRGAGKSAQVGSNYAGLSREQLVSDGHELVTYLKSRLGVEKVYLMGFSWGSVLGLSLVKAHPEDFAAFISVGQEVDFAAGEKLSLEYTRQMAQRTGDKQAQAELAGINPAYNSPDWERQLNLERKWLLQFGGVYHTANSYGHEIGMMLKAPEYSLFEVGLWPFSSSRSLKQMWPELMKINFFEEVPQVDCPAAFFVGRYDFNTPGQLIEAYYQKLQAPAGKRLVWFENSAHDIFFDEPEQLTQELLAVLAAQEKAGH
jgi:pimeloyl-ACP methyl ester carboxylesterase